MSVKLDKLENNAAHLEIEVDAVKFEEGMQKAYIKNKKKFNIPGFRKGKVPRKMVEKYYGESIFYEDAINIVCPDAYDKAIEETKIEPVDRPEIDIKQIGNGENLIFTATVTVKPDFELGDYKGIEVKKIEYNVTEEDIDRQINEMREKNSRLITVEDRAVQMGDTAQIDFEGFADGEPFEGGKGENYDLEIGSGQFIPGFEEQLIGKNIGEELEVNVTFPEEYHAEDLAGKPVVFKVKIHQIKFKELPELDDEFVKDVSEFDTIKELKEDMSKKLTEQNEQKAKQETENAVIDKVVEDVTIDIPEVMIERQIDSMTRDFEMRLSMQGMNLDKYFEYTGQDQSAFRQQFKEQAGKQVKTSLVLEKIAEVENVQVSDEDVEKHLEKMAESYKMEVDKMKEMLKPENIDAIKEDLAIQNTVKMLVQAAKLA